MSAMFHICMDTGGTFTDGVLIDDSGNVNIAKSQTTPDNLHTGIIECTRLLANTRPDMTLTEFMGKVGTFTFSTTVADNALIQLNGARACMLTTKGFRDILEWRRMMIKPNIYDLRLPKPVLIPRYMRLVAEERIDAAGKVIIPLNESDVREAAFKFKVQNAEAIAVCFLHSYINPDHERRAGEILREELPGV
ncbi:hydantoinase/oxoprolinase N-terminal domain-containing protein, partial [Candidatus Omnitrophota bacterium]